MPNVAPVIGELAFFVGVPQPATIKARPDGDVNLLVLSKDDSDDLFQNYPEQVTQFAHFIGLLVESLDGAD